MTAPASPPQRPLSIPVFEGRDSRRHRTASPARLRAEALMARARFGGVGRADTFVQFTGYPRSNHSLIGSIIDAHPGAVVAHELDVMGLVENGFAEAEICALIRANSAAFQRHGRWWNGYAYAMEGGSGGRGRDARVIGDKKGDLAVRRLTERPALMDRLTARIPRRHAWILVLRNPFDNIATMSLRKGRAYDRLRIAASSPQAFRQALRAEQGRTIPAEALPEMIDDYARLSDGIAAMQARTSDGDWFMLRTEELGAAPADGIRALLDFLGLPDRDGFAARAGALVRPSPNRSRKDVAWPDAARAAVERIIDRHTFLHGYSFDD